MSKFKATLKKELLELIPPTTYFFVALSLVALIRALMVHGTGMPATSFVTVLISSLVVGKSVLLSDLLPILKRHPNRPLIYSVILKSTIYLVVATGIHYLERVVDYWREAGSFVAGNEKMLSEIVWTQFWAIHILLCILIVAYCLGHELASVLGRAKLMQIFFGRPASAPA